jgi:hypothetical protein
MTSQENSVRPGTVQQAELSTVFDSVGVTEINESQKMRRNGVSYLMNAYNMSTMTLMYSTFKMHCVGVRKPSINIRNHYSIICHSFFV